MTKCKQYTKQAYPSIFEQDVERAPLTDYINHTCIESVLVGWMGKCAQSNQTILPDSNVIIAHPPPPPPHTHITSCSHIPMNWLVMS